MWQIVPLLLYPFIYSIVSMSLVDLGKRLLEAAKQGLTDEVRTLMSNGAPFTTDWVSLLPEPGLRQSIILLIIFVPLKLIWISKFVQRVQG